MMAPLVCLAGLAHSSVITVSMVRSFVQGDIHRCLVIAAPVVHCPLVIVLVRSRSRCYTSSSLEASSLLWLAVVFAVSLMTLVGCFSFKLSILYHLTIEEKPDNYLTFIWLYLVGWFASPRNI